LAQVKLHTFQNFVTHLGPRLIIALTTDVIITKNYGNICVIM